MTPSRFATVPRIMAAMITSLALIGCNTTAGLGRDVSAGADAVTSSAEQSKTY